jgi:nucleoside-diphosphate-sugar epimerase
LVGLLAQHWTADTPLVRHELGYTEIVDVDEAIQRTVAWERLQ